VSTLGRDIFTCAFSLLSSLGRVSKIIIIVRELRSVLFPFSCLEGIL
jgi:hypothetical protein